MTLFNKFSVLCGICLLGMSTLSQAQLYKWVDEDGVTQYTQAPPLGDIEAESIKVKTTPPNTSAIKNLDSQLKRADGLREKRLEDMENKRIDEENEARKVENCRRSRGRLASNSVPNALIQQQDGSRIRIDEDTRQRELVASREMIEKYCN